MAKIIYEKEKCIGCGMCASACPEHWQMGSDGKAELKDGTEENGQFSKQLDQAGCNDQAAANCPVQCIHVQND